MQITIKKLQGGECNLEVLPTTTILEIKRQIEEKMTILVENQKLLLLGKTLVDDSTVESYPTIKNGTKLMLVVKKPDGLFEVACKLYKEKGMSDTESKSQANRLLSVVQEKFNKLSWDDIERLSLDCMSEENGQPLPRKNIQRMDL